MKSLVLNTLILVDASATRRRVWYTMLARVSVRDQNTLRNIWFTFIRVRIVISTAEYQYFTCKQSMSKTLLTTEL